jgi:hypothetical protein
LIVAGIGLVGCAIGFFVNAEQFYRSWLIAYLLFLGITLGSMAFVMIQHLSGGAWGVFRRIFEASSRTILLLAVLFIPVLIGMTSLYPWANDALRQSDEVLRHKAPYLNVPFFIARVVFYFAVWSGLSYLLNKWSQQQDAGDVAVNTRIQRLSGAGLVLYALTVTFAGIDWIMSLNPHWYSTLFGFLMMGGQGLAALAFTIVVASLPLPLRADVAAAQASALPRPRQADARVRDALRVFQLLAVHVDVRRESHRRDSVHDDAHPERLAVPRAVPDDLPFRGAVSAAAVARPQARLAPPGDHCAVVNLHAAG